MCLFGTRTDLMKTNPKKHGCLGSGGPETSQITQDFLNRIWKVPFEGVERVNFKKQEYSELDFQMYKWCEILIDGFQQKFSLLIENGWILKSIWCTPVQKRPQTLRKIWKKKNILLHIPSRQRNCKTELTLNCRAQTVTEMRTSLIIMEWYNQIGTQNKNWFAWNSTTSQYQRAYLTAMIGIYARWLQESTSTIYNPHDNFLNHLHTLLRVSSVSSLMDESINTNHSHGRNLRGWWEGL